MSDSKPIIVGRRFCGPPGSGNGGYVCGLLSRHILPDAEVKLLRPIPLETPLSIEIRDESHAMLISDGHPIAEAHPADHLMESILEKQPVPPSYEEAEKASKNYIGFHGHPFPTCFVCGPQRAQKDGLRIFAGRLDGKNIVAAPWNPDKTLADAEGIIRPEFIWAALDCPGAFAVSSEKLPRIVLGVLAVKILNKIFAGEEMVVVGWEIGDEGRKAHAATAVFSASGQLLAAGRATWVRLE